MLIKLLNVKPLNMATIERRVENDYENITK